MTDSMNSLVEDLLKSNSFRTMMQNYLENEIGRINPCDWITLYEDKTKTLPVYEVVNRLEVTEDALECLKNALLPKQIKKPDKSWYRRFDRKDRK